jgi:3-hydroxyethyl bacteriochlorophyllide a dehydrogenase
MGYPLVPGYESVGRVTHAGRHAGFELGERVFVPGARCYGAVRGLMGGASSLIVAPAARVVTVSDSLGDSAVLLALAATALHAVNTASEPVGSHNQGVLIVGHGVLGRLLARLVLVAGGAAPKVWETNRARCSGAVGYEVTAPEADLRRDYRTIFDVSGDPGVIDKLVPRLAPKGEIVLAGFYDTLSFAFPPAFMREARLRIAAQWAEGDLQECVRLIESGRLSLDGLITHRRPSTEAAAAYPVAFGDPDCLKMVLDWRALA